MLVLAVILAGQGGVAHAESPTRHRSGLALVKKTDPDPQLVSKGLAEAYERAERLAVEHPDDFGYPYVDEAQDHVVLRAASPDGVARATRVRRTDTRGAMLAVERVSLTFAQLERVKDDATRLDGVLPDADLIWATEPDTVNNRVVISVHELSDRLLDGIAARYGTAAVAIRVERGDDYSGPGGRNNDTSPFYGGAFINSPRGCTTAFSWVSGSTSMMLTAGHCAPGTYTVATPSQSMGRVSANSRENWNDSSGTTYLSGQSVYRGDLALIQMSSGRSSSGYIYRGGFGSSSSSPVKEMWSRSPAVGDQYCVGGRVTGELCGWKVDKVRYNQKYTRPDPDQWVRNINRGKKKGICTALGDSGGPVYTVRSDNGIAAKGVHSGLGGGGSDNYGGTFDPCYEYFTDIREAYYGFPGVLRRI